MPPRSRHSVPPPLRVPGLANGARHASLAEGSLERACPVSWHNRPPDGILEGHKFTDGSSTGSGALRRAGRAVVAVDDVENLKTAAYGAVPSDVLLAQTSRDGEDYAAALAGHVTVDLLTLHIDCAGTIASVSGHSAKPWALGFPSTRLEQATGFPRRGQSSQGQGPRHAARHGGQASGRGPRLAQVQGLERHQGCRAKNEDAGEAEAQATGGDRSAGFRAQLAVGTRFRLWVTSVGPCHHFLRQMWSSVLGTCGRAVPQLHRNSWRAILATPQIGATTLVAQLDEVAVLEHWARFAEATTTEDQALQRWDQGRPGLLAAYGLNDQLVTKLAFKTLATCALWAAMDLPPLTKRQYLRTSGSRFCRQWCTSA